MIFHQLGGLLTSRGSLGSPQTRLWSFACFSSFVLFLAEDLILNPKEHPNAKLGDVVEIYQHPEEENGCRLLLQITCFKEDLKGRDIISVEANVAAAFNLRTYETMIMNIVDPASVALDSVEITFKDQYMGRSEMWRLKSFLTNTCVYTNKKIEYCSGLIRCQVYEMWAQGERVSCGVINEDTKVVFRSSTSMVYLFIQMSSEMWDFDIHGDLYFEKAVNGFLTDLFLKWKKLGSNPEVTIVLFSRTFYAAKSLDEFPAYMRECLQMDYKGRYYEDFYRVAIQNERNDDWSTILVQLRRLFTSYQNTVLRYHDRSGSTVPATNSTAAQGNFLEVLNISLNVFEKHYLDRSFDRTGQLSVVITPGVGVFEVDRELTNITKQRIIDNGVGSDLVCVGEQPLHAVPLLKFHNKDSSLNTGDDYSMPHWINLSFYSTNKKVAYSTFIPRIKLPPLNSKKNSDENKDNKKFKLNDDTQQQEYIHNSLFDYDAYDAQIFTIPSSHGTCSLQRQSRTKKTSVPCLDGYGTCTSREWENMIRPQPVLRRKMSDPDIHHGNFHVLSNLSHDGSPGISESMSTLEKQGFKNILNQNGSIVRPGRALINPFAPSHVTIKLTSNRRRWTHIFPKGPTGVLIQQHHYQAVPTSNGISNKKFADLDSSDFDHTSTCTIGGSIDVAASVLAEAAGPLVTVEPSKSLTLLWGATGEQEWTPALTTGVDWKSLTIPACLPITTDYFPDKRSLHNDYVVSDYALLPEGVNDEYAQNRAVYRKPLSTEEVFKELISQRLAQGFQLIVVPDKSATSPPQAPCCGGLLHKHHQHGSVPKSSILNISNTNKSVKEYLLSIGRIFHKITLNDSEITVTRYRPRHPYPPINIDYRYRFQAPQHDTYEVSGVNFTTEKLENFPWNYMDQYICTRGDADYPLQENLKYWRHRMYLLPKEHPAFKKILESSSASIHCDIFVENSTETPKQIIDDFKNFSESYLNKIKKLHCPKMTKGLLNSPFRERLGSNILPDMRPRLDSHVSMDLLCVPLRSGTKTMEKGPGRVSPAAEAAGLSLNNPDNHTNAHTAQTTTDEKEDSFLNELKISPTASLTEILEAMKSPVNGINFLAKSQSLPSWTFVLLDAIVWLQNRIDGKVNPLEILEAMRKADMICHASGKAKAITPGFFLYYVVSQDKKSPDYMPPINDLETFENEWMEVEINSPDNPYDTTVDNTESGVPKFLRENVDVNFFDGPIYKHAYLDIDISQKSERTEWGHLRYHTRMTPGYAYEIVVQWLIASGPVVNHLVNTWKRKANQSGFQLISIPADPLAEPFTDKSDPLRGPIFIPLNIHCLEKEGSSLFKEFKKETWPDRLLLLQEAIVARFGFMASYAETKTGSNQGTLDRQYIHCSGLMFILVASPHEGLKVRQRLASGSQMKRPTFIKRCPPSIDAPSTGIDTYVTRHVNVKNKEEFDVPRKIGFLWSWNHMIANKHWKMLTLSNTPDCELFQLRMLQDFKDFCSNQNDRLLNFWEDCWIRKEKTFTKDHS
ncbi:GATOR complex protein Iml1 [Pseudolycoriella hygida]|uniref:GATOR complex protein Iml1 n=1 Tax=Pseudolycoriella hygida TaxID=35572 RepID=A0A9Q0N7N1_9DIPT|nr:GATOR complex protein Iml1 [Pseudolycoriella hygida]